MHSHFLSLSAVSATPSCSTLLRMDEEERLAEKVGRACIPPPGKSSGFVPAEVAAAGEER